MSPDGRHWTLEEWLELGEALGYCSEARCGMHDTPPMTAEEGAAFEAGGDPCIAVVRLYVTNHVDRS